MISKTFAAKSPRTNTSSSSKDIFQKVQYVTVDLNKTAVEKQMDDVIKEISKNRNFMQNPQQLFTNKATQRNVAFSPGGYRGNQQTIEEFTKITVINGKRTVVKVKKINGKIVEEGEVEKEKQSPAQTPERTHNFYERLGKNAQGRRGMPNLEDYYGINKKGSSKPDVVKKADSNPAKNKEKISPQIQKDTRSPVQPRAPIKEAKNIDKGKERPNSLPKKPSDNKKPTFEEKKKDFLNQNKDFLKKYNRNPDKIEKPSPNQINVVQYLNSKSPSSKTKPKQSPASNKKSPQIPSPAKIIPSLKKTELKKPAVATKTQEKLTGNYSSKRMDDASTKYVPLKIKWELGPVMNYCKVHKIPETCRFLKRIIMKATAVLKMYIWVPEDTSTQIVAGKSACNNFFIPKESLYEGHLLMMGRIYVSNESEDSVIAKSIYCDKDSNQRSTIGKISFNLKNIPSKDITNTLEQDYLLTVIHETLHTLAFYSDSQKTLVEKEIPSHLNHLKTVSKTKDEIYDSGHWDEAFIPNDLMGPVSRPESILTIYSIELLEQRSMSYLGQRNNLPHNLFFDNVESENKFFNYRCDDNDETAKYKFFCSRKQAAANHSSCSIDYTFVTGCSRVFLNNNCFKSFGLSQHNCMDPLPHKGEKNWKDYEHRGSDARCFDSVNNSRGMCLKYKVQNNKVKVILGTNSYECEYSGQKIAAKYNISERKYYDVNFVCPNLEEFIKYEEKTGCPDQCNQNGFCSNGKCICFEGWNSKNNCKTQTTEISSDAIFTENQDIKTFVTVEGT